MESDGKGGAAGSVRHRSPTNVKSSVGNVSSAGPRQAQPEFSQDSNHLTTVTISKQKSPSGESRCLEVAGRDHPRSSSRPGEDTAVAGHSHSRPGNASDHTWLLEEAVPAVIATCAEALMVDDSKSVRAKALASALRVLRVHGTRVVDFGNYGESHDEAAPVIDGDTCTRWRGIRRALEIVSFRAFGPPLSKAPSPVPWLYCACCVETKDLV